MGSNLHAFEVRLQFDQDGGVSNIIYEDADGCGKEQEVTPGMSVGALVEVHLSHYDKNHDERPRQTCRYVVDVLDGPKLRCVIDSQDPHTTHHFKLQE